MEEQTHGIRDSLHMSPWHLAPLLFFPVHSAPGCLQSDTTELSCYADVAGNASYCSGSDHLHSHTDAHLPRSYFNRNTFTDLNALSPTNYHAASNHDHASGNPGHEQC